VTSVSGSPDMTVNLNDGYYTFSMTTTGGNPREMFTIPFTDDPAVLVFNGFGGFYYGFHGLLDNGTSGGDPVAGDGVFTNDGVWLVAEPPAGVDPFVLRAAVSTDEGVASFADAVGLVHGSLSWRHHLRRRLRRGTPRQLVGLALA
jgi:hypothetical protein